MTPKVKTIIIVSSASEGPAAIKYQSAHSQENIRLITTDISSILFFDRLHINHTPIFHLTSSAGTKKLSKIPFKISKNYLSHPQIKNHLRLGKLDLTIPLAVMLNFKLVFDLEKHYFLAKLHQKLTFNKLISNHQVFSKNILEFFGREHNVEVADLAQWETSTLKLQKILNRKWQALLNELRKNFIFLSHPTLTAKTLLHPPEQALTSGVTTKRKSVLVFSNGLNLASYHSVFKELTKFVNVNIITGKQSILDRFYLSQYQLNTLELNKQHPEITAKTNQLKRQLSLLNSKPNPGTVKTSDIESSLGIKSKIVKELPAKATRFLLKNWLNNFLNYYAAAQVIIAKFKPSLVVTTHDPGPSGVAFTLAAKEKHIPATILVHASPSETHFFFADKEIIWGPLMKRLLVKHGVEEKKLEVGGHPIYHDYQQFFQRHPRFPGRETNIGIITSGFGINEINQVQFFLGLLPQLAKIKKKITVKVRAHQTHRLDGLMLLAKKYKLNIKSAPHLLLEEFVAQSDIIITQDSTAALVPLIARKPTIMLNSSNPFLERGLIMSSPAFLKVKNYRSIPKAINSLLNNPAFLKQKQKLQQKYLFQYCGPIDQNIGQRITKKLLKLIK